MPSSLILPLFFTAAEIAAGGFAVAAATLGIRLVTAYVVSSLIMKRGESGSSGGSGSAGGRVQIPPNVDNKIPVLYGSAYLKPIITDAKITKDNKKMWYVLTFSEVPDSSEFTFGDMYWGDKKLNFDATDTTKVISWTDSNDETDTKIDGKIRVWFYKNGSAAPVTTGAGSTTRKAYEVLGVDQPGDDTGIDDAVKWSSTDQMNKLAFIIVSLEYASDVGLTSLGEISLGLSNNLTKPGSVIKDYLTNTRYGAGLALEAINLNSLTALDTYSDDTISYTKADATIGTAPRFRINGPIDTTKSYLANLNNLVDTCDSWLQWNEILGKWGVIINQEVSEASIRTVNSDSIIGGVNITPIDLNSTYNNIEVQFANSKARDQTGYVYANIRDFPHIVRSPNEPDNNFTLSLPFTNNEIEAQYLGYRRLLQSREDLTISFTMDYSGIQIDAGDVIGVTHEWYGWPTQADNPALGKLFRVNQVQEAISQDGSLYAKIVASEYNPLVYANNIEKLLEATLSLNTGISNPRLLSNPGKPVISNVVYSSTQPSFTVSSSTPTKGSIVGMEFWYANAADYQNNKFIRYSTEINNASNTFNNGQSLAVIVTGLPADTYVWKTRAVGIATKSGFSQVSDSIAWVPNTLGTIVGQNFEAHFVPPTIGIKQNSSGTVFYSEVAPRLYGQSGGAMIDFVPATNDADPVFINNTWRIGYTSNTGPADIILEKVVYGTLLISDQGAYAQFNSPTSLTSSTGIMTVPVRYKNNLGEVYQGIPAAQQFVILTDGTKGDPGKDGKDGVGSTGTTGPRTATGFIYYNISQETAPDAPYAIGYNFSTGSFNNISSGWSTTYTASAAAQSKYWAVSYTVSEVTYQGQQVITLSSVFNWISFNGLVTFNNLAVTSSTTFINGGNITTDSIEATSIKATAFYGKSFQSTNATLDNNTSAGAWINGTNGNARFAGTVSIGNNLKIANSATIGTNLIVGDNATIGNNVTIGNNLTVAGLINGGQLAVGIVTTSSLSSGVINLISSGTNTVSELGTRYVNSTVTLGNNSTYDQFFSTGASFYGWWKTIGYTDILSNPYVGGGNGRNIRVTFNATMNATGINGYPNGPILLLFQNDSTNGGSGVTIWRDGGSSFAPQYGLTFGSATSYSGPVNLSATFGLSQYQTINTHNIVGVGLFNGNGTYSGNLGNIQFTNIQFSVTLI
jgi:hypothetical protein